MFAKYDLDGDRVLGEEEQKRMQADLADQKVSMQNISQHMGSFMYVQVSV